MGKETQTREKGRKVLYGGDQSKDLTTETFGAPKATTPSVAKDTEGATGSKRSSTTKREADKE